MYLVAQIPLWWTEWLLPATQIAQFLVLLGSLAILIIHHFTTKHKTLQSLASQQTDSHRYGTFTASENSGPSETTIAIDRNVNKHTYRFWNTLRLAGAGAGMIFYIILIFTSFTDNTSHDGDSTVELNFRGLGLITWTYAFILSAVMLRSVPTYQHLATHLNLIYIVAFLSPLVVVIPRILYPQPTPLSFTILFQTFLPFSLILVWIISPRVFHPVGDHLYPVSPEQTASWISILTFSWLDKLIRYGWWNTINDDDIYPLPDYDHASYNVSEYEKARKKRSLFVNIAYYFWPQYALMLSLSIVWSLTAFIPPLALRTVIGYIENPSQYTISPYILVLGLLVGPALETVIFQYILWISTKLLIRMRALLSAELYRKVLNVREQGSADPTDEEAKSRVGKITNLIQSDVATITDMLELIIYVFTSPLRIGLCIWFLYYLLGWASLAGLVVIFITMPIPTIVTKQFGKLQERVMKATDKRLGLVTELLSNIRVIKFFAWEDAMMKRINEARANELKEIKARNVNYLAMGLIWGVIPLMVMLTTFFVYTKIMGRELTASVAFTALSLFQIFSMLIGILPWSIGTIMRAKVSYDRISKFLDEPEIEKHHEEQNISILHSQPVAMFENATYKWFDTPTTSDVPKAVAEQVTALGATLSVSAPPSGSVTPQRQFMLRDLDFTFPRGELSLIAGPTGSGKTSVLMSLLGEMSRVSGTSYLDRTGGVAYVSQTAWLQNDTIKENILFGEKFDEERYKKVLSQCALLPDLAVLEAGDETEIGEKGITLSGGQKQRIALARAVYSQAHTVLLDDCLSAVDAHTAKHLYTQCLMGDLLKNRTRILVTHYVSLCAKGAAFIVVLKNGRTVGHGKVADIMKKGTAASVLLEDENSDLKNEEKEVEDALDLVPEKLLPKAGPSSTAVIEDNKSVGSDETKVAKTGKLMTNEDRSEGSVGWPVYKLYLSACGGPGFWLLLLLTTVIGHLANFSSSWWIQVWTRSYETTITFMSYTKTDLMANSGDLLVPDMRFSYLASSQDSNAEHSLDYYLGIYALIGLTYTSINLLTWYLIILGALVASRRLHDRLLNTICAAPIRWFDRIPVGRITNRFAKDMEIIDSEVSDNMSHVIDNAVTALGVLVVVSVVLPLFLIPGVFIVLLFVGIGYSYIRTNLALRRLASIHRSPIYSHFGDSIVGIVTIRAFSVGDRFFKKTLTLVDQLNRPQIFMYSINRWLHIRSDITSGFVAFIAGFLALLSHMNAGLAGMSIILAMQFTDAILWLVRNYNVNELNMNSVERIMEYLQIDQEPASTEHGKPSAAWPTSGDVKFEHVTTRYFADSPAVLKDLSFEVKSCEKLGIVGRTGSGKSTLALTILRFLEHTEGRILIDGVDINSLNLEDLRRRVTIIPQDPVLFSGTIRSNLDPFNQYDDAVLNDAMRQSHLNINEEILNSEQQEHAEEYVRITLDSTVSENGSNFSQGQRQLIALARALVRKSKVIIMDEATASVDTVTDNKIQKTIRSEFGESTLLTIAHRLRTVADFDKILVLDQGKIVEHDEPYILMKNDKTIFHAMCKKSGEYSELLKIAKAHHEAMKKRHNH